VADVSGNVHAPCWGPQRYLGQEGLIMADTIWNTTPPPPQRRNHMATYLAAGMIALLGAGLMGSELRAKPAVPQDTLAQAVSEFDAGHLGLATSSFQKLAGDGNPYAAYWYGYALNQGLGTPVDAKAAIAEYQKALDGGVTRAATKLGELYLNGNVIPPDFAKARGYFTEAAQRGDADAALNLGHMLRDGIGGAANPVEAYAWLEVASLRGNAEARIDRDRILMSLSPDQQAAASREAIALDAAKPATSAPATSAAANPQAAPSPVSGNKSKTGA
jgi:TPR repeat protein